MDFHRLAPNISIRRMQPHDWTAVRELWKESGLSDEQEDSFDDVVAFLSSSQSAGFIAEQTDRVIGAVLCGSDGRYGYVHHLAVSSTTRRLRVGSSLVQECVAFMKTRHVVLMVRESNRIAKEFWSDLGFQKVHGLDVLAANTTQGLMTPDRSLNENGKCAPTA